MSQFGIMLRQQRTHKNKTQLEVAQATTIPRTKISHYECAKQLPSRTNLQKLLDFYETEFNIQSQIKRLWSEEKQHCTRWSVC